MSNASFKIKTVSYDSGGSKSKNSQTFVKMPEGELKSEPFSPPNDGQILPSSMPKSQDDYIVPSSKDESSFRNSRFIPHQSHAS